MARTRNLTDAEIERLGYEALMERLGPVGAARFVRLQHEHSKDDYAKVKDEIFEGMTTEEIYAEAVRLDAKRTET